MTTNASQDKRLAQLEAQQSIQTAALQAFLEGDLEGTKALLLALNPTLEVTPADFAFGQ